MNYLVSCGIQLLERAFWFRRVLYQNAKLGLGMSCIFRRESVSPSRTVNS